ncbi:hypothetical protein BKA66DRAFT_447367 [Pyrenochaeta sp. MPI-SDFR-AT-0127]|nr:hypothetical protein BKA66DRAFT_447367 [Pyrenochaeta sp. MPI-SDFR-AT-0127]
MIARVNREKADGPQSNTTVYVEEIFNCKADRQNGAYSSARVNTKRICLSWDLREEAHNMKSVVMNGKTYRDLRLGVDVGNGARSPPIFYHLRDSQRLAGEMGVVSATRWELAGYLSLNKLLNGVGTCAEYCCSDGFGKVMRDGLHGVVEDDFEASELEVSELIYN